MKHPLRYVLVLALATGSVSLGACSDDSSTGEEDNGGSAGVSGSKTGGSSAGGSVNNGGKAGGTSTTAGAGGATDGGAGGAVDAGAGGSAGDGGGSDAGGAAGAGGAGLVYACGSADLWQKTCSAWVAAECPDETVCSDCVTALTADRVGFTDPACAACDDKYEAFYQCQVDAFESGNLAFGVECLEGLGAVETENCYPLLDEAIACQGYVGSDQDPKPCPTTWPPQ